jgi:hypothetical protein
MVVHMWQMTWGRFMAVVSFAMILCPVGFENTLLVGSIADVLTTFLGEHAGMGAGFQIERGATQSKSASRRISSLSHRNSR